jgi:hypothetical protein
VIQQRRITAALSERSGTMSPHPHVGTLGYEGKFDRGKTVLEMVSSASIAVKVEIRFWQGFERCECVHTVLFYTQPKGFRVLGEGNHTAFHWHPLPSIRGIPYGLGQGRSSDKVTSLVRWRSRFHFRMDSWHRYMRSDAAACRRLLLSIFVKARG